MNQINPPTHRSFRCDHCSGEIQIPFNLPPTQAACPHCAQVTTSPPPPEPVPAAGTAVPGPEPEPVVNGLEGSREAAQSISVDVHVPVRGRAESNVTTAPVAVTQPVVPAVEAPGSPSGEIQTIPTAPPPDPGIAPAESDGTTESESRPAVVGHADAGNSESVVVDPLVDVVEKVHTEPEAGPRKGGRRIVKPIVFFVIALLAVLSVLGGLVVWQRQNVTDVPVVDLGVDDAPAPKGVDEIQQRRYLREGWKEDTAASLTAFLEAPTISRKADFVIGGSERLEEMRAFYGQDRIDESGTPLTSFRAFDLDHADKERGIFMMRYERPAQVDIREFFRPVAPLEVQKGLEEPGLLLSAFASRSNFAMEPVRVLAFFKREQGKMLLDWDVYRQTKYRTMRHFLGNPEPGASMVVRVIVSEDRPPFDNDVTQQRYYRVSDPAHDEDNVVVPVVTGSKAGEVLQTVAWVQTSRRVQNRYATVELVWSEDEEPKMLLSQVVCWEFLGLGGVVGNAHPAPAPELITTPAESGEDSPEQDADPAEAGGGEAAPGSETARAS